VNYFKQYDNLITKHGSAEKKVQGYSERHHIFPKCLGGDNSEENLTYLNARCHLLAHWLLMKTFPDEKGLKIAYATMCSRKGVRLSPKMYQLAKEAVSGDNSLRARAVVTPKGEFPTVAAAALAHKVAKAIISRKAGSDSILHQGYFWKDEKISGTTPDGRNAHHLQKGVRTPYGDFKSVREAGRMIGIYHSTISKRIKRGDIGYSYL
jgi:hypothetical protein